MTDDKEPQSTEDEPSGEDASSEPQAPAGGAPTVSTPATPAPETPTPTQPIHSYMQERRLVRRPEGKVIAGVCTGLGAYTGVDPVAWRIAFVVLGLTTGIGLVGYIVAWLVMPMAREGDVYPPLPSDPTRVARWVGIGALIVGAIVLFRNLPGFDGSWFWGLLLIGVGIALFGREFSARNGHDRPLPTAVITSPPPPSAIGAGGDIPTTQTQPFSPAAPTVPSPSPAPPPKKRDPSVLGRLVVGAAALAVGLSVLLNKLGVTDVSGREMLPALLALVGAGLILGAWWGRARWLIFPGFGLLIALSVASYVPTGLHGSFGDVVWQPTDLDQLESNYEHGGGNVELDLSRIAFGDEHEEVDVEVNFGNLEVVVPADVDVIVNAEVRGGNMEIFGAETRGFQQGEQSVRDEGTGRSGGELELNIDVGFGNIEVRRPRTGELLGNGSRVGSRIRIRNGDVRISN